MTKDEQARARLVEIALEHATQFPGLRDGEQSHYRHSVRSRAGFKNPHKGHFCAAGLTAAMEDAGLLVPAPGTPARRGAVALLDFVWAGDSGLSHDRLARWKGGDIKPGDIIAWLQHPPQSATSWRYVDGKSHLFLGPSPRSVCTLGMRDRASGPRGGRCSSCVWYTRQGHVALIVAVDDESVTTVGWNEGNAPGRVMMRRLWRSAKCHACDGQGGGDLGSDLGGYPHHVVCKVCDGKGKHKPASTVLWRRPGGIYGIARPVAR